MIASNPHYSPNEKQTIGNIIRELLKEDVISVVNPCEDQFISSIFVIPKHDGNHRLIINLKSLNEFIKMSHFKIEDHRTVSRLMTCNCFMSKIDISNAYYHIPIKQAHRKYLRFRFEGSLFEYNVLPFGLNCAPLIFTKVLKPVISKLREKGYLSVAYLDDILLLGKSQKECKDNVRRTVELFEYLGFLINYKKSNLSPSHICQYLGLVYNATTMRVSLPSEKRVKINALLRKFSTVKHCKIREFVKFIGSLVSATPAIKYSFLHTKLFERERYLALLTSKNNYDAKMYLPSSLSTDFSWWISKIFNGTNEIRIDKYQVEVYTDASKSGWGVYWNSKTTFGFWSEEEKNLHINLLELWAVYFGLKCLGNEYSGCNILCRVDNTTAVSVINRMGSVRFQNLNKLARMIWEWCQERDIYVFASYINTKDNIYADKASRKTHKETEWSLADSAFIKIKLKLGVPVIDLFASRLNRKCTKFVSWMRDPEAYKVDAFTLNWGGLYFYAFPPFSMILRVLQKIIRDNAEGIVVVPFWVSQPWYPLYKSLLITEPLILQPENMLLSFRGVPHPLSKNLSLVAGRLSGKRFSEERFHQTL